MVELFRMKPIERSRSLDFLILEKIGIFNTVLSRIFIASLFFLGLSQKLIIMLHSRIIIDLFILYLLSKWVYFINFVFPFFLIETKIDTFSLKKSKIISLEFIKKHKRIKTFKSYFKDSLILISFFKNNLPSVNRLIKLNFFNNPNSPFKFLKS